MAELAIDISPPLKKDCRLLEGKDRLNFTCRRTKQKFLKARKKIPISYLWRQNLLQTEKSGILMQTGLKKILNLIIWENFRYTLKAQGQGAGAFNIGPSSGIVKLAKELDFEDLRQPHIYQLLVTATEDSGGFSTSVEVLSIFGHCCLSIVDLFHGFYSSSRFVSLT